MKITHVLASAALAPAALAQGLRQATGGNPDATPVPWYPEPSPEVSDCDANLITSLCDYKKPAPGTAVASSGKKHCMEYCNEHPPCNFVIFAAGNPYTGSGTCWLYPGEDFDESLGETGCDYLSVFDKPDCGDATPTAGACEATNSPEAAAEVCDYPPPDEECFYNCAASSGASNCMSLCVEADECSYAVFNPRNENMSQYQSGTCWMYPSGQFDANKAKTCSGDTKQYVYENPCPKPPKPSTSTSMSSSSSATGTSTATGSAASPSDTGSGRGATAEGATADEEKDGDDSNGSAHVGLSLAGAAVGLVVLMWQGL